MASNHFQVEVVAADRKLYSGEAVSLVAPGMSGSFGVLRGHAPLVSALTFGELEIQPIGNTPRIHIAVQGGFIEVTPDRVVVLADAAELAEDIDVERARIAKDRAEERLRLTTSETDITRAQAALARAINRLHVATRHI